MADGDIDGAYQQIGEYGYISDCHSAALISRDGSVDWCCMPRMDEASVFGRLLDARRGGFCSIRPLVDDAGITRRYARDSLVLETIVRGSSGEARVLDCFTIRLDDPRRPYRQLLRVVDGIRGWLPFSVRVAPRFDYGEVEPWLRRGGPNLWTAIGGNDGLLIACDLELERADEPDLGASFRVRAGQRVRLSLQFQRPERLDPVGLAPSPPAPEELDRRLERTIAWWVRWAERLRMSGPDAAAVRRSAVVLKGLQDASTGAIAAAPTTSLPEQPGGDRNWDYRASWVRDSTFTARSLAVLGAGAEADQFRRFVERSAAGSVRSLQVAYGIGGERRLSELTLDLAGYKGAHPVRAGNAAARQVQLDVYGELLDLAWRWHRRGRSPEDDYWRFLLELVDTAANRWQEPDRGIWELRGEPRHFVHSKVMCWVALDRGVRLAEECLRQAPVRRWAKVRDEVRAAVEHDGYDDDRGIFVEAFASKALDAALLLLPTVGFVPYDDERMVRTTDAIRTELADPEGLILRYRPDRTAGGPDASEGAFIACSFWLVECLAHQGRAQEARDLFDRVSACGNDLGLLSEEFDSRGGQLLGNFPQGLSHLSHITAAVALAEHQELSTAGP
ncbi:MAG TPA: glycoside hydrolase family 15 protein [Actinomycetota bacterium]|nr:glycoside hydrolase family 15 protein [Actinomycetota bacterium]